MENIFKEFSELEVCQDELQKIDTLNDMLKQISSEVKKQNEEHLKTLTNIFNTKLKTNKNYNEVVNNYINKYVITELREDAREELFMLLTCELLSIFKGITNASLIR